MEGFTACPDPAWVNLAPVSSLKQIQSFPGYFFPGLLRVTVSQSRLTPESALNFEIR
jgi:hypothetical protein